MTVQKRLFRVLLIAAAALLCGFGYALLVRRLGFGIPCMFKMFTGYDCPSCGISRMFLALFRLDLAAAFAFNPVILCLLPLFAAVGIRWAYRYVRYGVAATEKWMNVSVLFSVAVLIVYGILRNFA